MKISTVVLALVASTAPTLVLASCGAGFCTVNSNWTTQSAAAEEGSLFDLRFEQLDQNQVRANRTNVGVGQIARHHSEIGTVNRNVLATYSHSFNADTGISVSIPLIDVLGHISCLTPTRPRAVATRARPGSHACNSSRAVIRPASCTTRMANRS